MSKKKETKPVISAETKKLLEEQEVTAELDTQRHEENVKIAEEKASKKVDISVGPVAKRSKAEWKALVDAYKAKNPVKYAMKKARLEALLK